MPITQATPTTTAITRRTGAALSQNPARARLEVALPAHPPGTPEPGQRGHLQHLLVSTIRTLHYSRRTEQAYWHWTRQFVLWSGKRHPVDMGAAEIGQFLSYLATERDVSASTQRQALAALLFLYQKALQIDLPYIDGIARAKQPQRLPCVLTVDEVRRVWDQIPPASKRGLVLRLLYGCGLRLMEALRLRVKDIDFTAGSITVRSGKGDKDRTVMLPRAIEPQLRALITQREQWHAVDLAMGRADVELPHALHRKYPSAPTMLGWQWVFATENFPTCPRTGVIRRHHLHEDGIQRLTGKVSPVETPSA
jgi:integron integrase